MSIILEAEHLTKIFRKKGSAPLKAVDDISFQLKEGETLGIVGESGSGKSTLAKLLTRLTDSTSGTLKYEGKDITMLKGRGLRELYGNMQMVFQDPVSSFDPRRTLGDGIGESLRNRGMKKEEIQKRVEEVLEQAVRNFDTKKFVCLHGYFTGYDCIYFVENQKSGGNYTNYGNAGGKKSGTFLQSFQASD